MTTTEKIALHEKALELLHSIETWNEILSIAEEELNGDALFLEIQRPSIEKTKLLALKWLSTEMFKYKLILKKLNNGRKD